MKALFGSSKKAARTVLLLDIENGSVAAAMAHLVPGKPPHLLTEVRLALPAHIPPHSVKLLRETQKLITEALTHIGTVAARLRTHEATDLGHIHEASIFIAPP